MKDKIHNYTITPLLFQNNRPIDWDVSQVQVQVNFALFKLVQYKTAYRISRLTNDESKYNIQVG